MATPATQSADDVVQSTLIPAGRESDFREIVAPPVDFLDMQIDRENMYIGPLPITNGSEDRDGEVTNPDGLIDVSYRKNPLVFLQHSHRISPMIPPVGTAETPDRQYDLHRRGDAWYSGCRFSQATRFARQIFRLVDDGTLRGRSIGALNHALSYYKPKLPGVAFHQNQIIPVRTKSISHDKYELVEWSWVWIPSNRDMVTPLKSIISKGWIDDRPIDPALKMILKSFDLSEPPSNAKHLSKKPRFAWPLRANGESAVKSPSALLFDSERYSLKDVKDFMVKNADLGIVDTNIDSQTINGKVFLRSQQFHHAGPTETAQDSRYPGFMLVFAKAATEEQIQQIVGDKAAAQVPDKQGQPATTAVVAKTDTEQAEAGAEQSGAVDVPAEAGEKLAGPGGLRYLKALIKNASMLADMMEAASADQEPEMMEKCGELNMKMRNFIKEVSEFEAERYGKNKPEEGMEEDEEPTAALSKAAKMGVFYGTKQLLPGTFRSGLQFLAQEVADEGHRKVIGAMLKGLAIPETKPDPEQHRRERPRADPTV